MPRKLSPLEEEEQIEVLWESDPEHRGVSKKLVPPTDIGQEEALELVGQLLNETHYTLLVNETATVGTAKGGPDRTDFLYHGE